jgi:DNA replication and repair protein RecF
MNVHPVRRGGGAADAGAPEAKAAVLTRLTLTDFRNYPDLRVETGGAPVVLTGPNGAGKTNLLEAISLLAPGRGLRGAAFEDLVRLDGGPGWAVASVIEAQAGTTALGTAWTRPGEANAASGGASGAASGAARQVQIAGEMQKSSGAFSAYLRILWLTPAMDRLFAGPASDRRRFLDRLVIAFDPEHGGRVIAFDKLMRDRNRVLSDAVPDQGWLGGLEHGMAEAGVAIAAARAAALDALQGFVSEMPAARNQSAFPWAGLEIDGDLEANVRHTPAVQVEDNYRKLLRDSRGPDRAAGRCLRGPHRSDLLVVHGPKAAEARMCSTGEQKALLIGLVLAHARAVRSACGGWAPIMLLDEVAAHLDEERRVGLFEELEELGVQAWMTGTDARLFSPLEGRAEFFRVGDGLAISGAAPGRATSTLDDRTS